MRKEKSKVQIRNKLSSNSKDSNSQLSDESEASIKVATKVPRISIAKPLEETLAKVSKTVELKVTS
jgi:hypothetical protein